MADKTITINNHYDEINGIIFEYLHHRNLHQAAEAFENELRSSGTPLLLPPTDNQVIDEEKHELLQLFNKGMLEDFFKKFDDYGTVLSKSFHNNEEYLKLEFLLQLYFAVFDLRKNNETDKECNDERMQKFKNFLESRGAPLSNDPDFLSFFALPYSTNPKQHSSFREVFQDSWVSDLRDRLEEYLDVVLTEKNKQIKPVRIVRMFSPLLNSENGTSETASVAELTTKLQEEKQKIVKLQENYQKLMQITTELLSALELAVKGEDVNFSTVMDKCLQAFPEMFSGSGTMEMEPSHVVNPLPAVELDRKTRLLPRSETQETLLVPLDFKKIKQDLMHSSPRLKTFILQALRWRLTNASPGEQRHSVLSGLTGCDILGTEGGIYGDAVISLIMSQTIELRQSIARLLNAFASLTAGRSYLSYGTNILSAIIDNIRLNKLDVITMDMSLATLQKLSLRRHLQTAMIKHNFVEFLITLLEEEEMLSDYASEYTVALLMNLCLRTRGKERCTMHPRRVLKILTNLLGNQNPEIIPYVNGTLYSLLTVPRIKKEAQSMGLEEILNCYMAESPPDLKRQLDFILKQLASDDLLEETTSDYEDEDDDDEEQDVLEEELNKDDVILTIPGELQGEKLLSTNYSLHSSETKMKGRRKEVLTRPTTPRMHAPSEMRMLSPQQAWLSETSETAEDSVHNEDPDTAGQEMQPETDSTMQTSESRAVTPKSPSLNCDKYASRVLNEVVGIEKSVTEATAFPPVLPREPEKVGGTSVNEYVVAFSSRPKIPRTPEHSGRRS